MQQPASHSHIAPLDGLRGLAILMVMCFHFVWAKPPQGLPAKILVFIGSFGWIGVDLFFVLSGFLITGILLDTKSDGSYFRKFYARRILRIFPLYYGVVIVTMLILPHFIAYDTPGLQRTLKLQGWLWIMSYNLSVAAEHGKWLIGSDWLGLGMLWSLAVEEHFYLFWPWVVFVTSRSRLLWIALGIVVAAPILRLVMIATGVPSGTIYSLTICRIDPLAMGAFLAIAVREPALLKRIAQPMRFSAVLALIIVLTITAHAKWFAYDGYNVQRFGYSALTVVFGALLLEAVTAPASSRLRGVLKWRWLVFFGKYSFGAYIFHELLRSTMEKWFPIYEFQRVTGSEVAAYLLHALGATVATFILAVLSFELFEKRFLAFKRYFEYRRSAQEATEGASSVMGKLTQPHFDR